MTMLKKIKIRYVVITFIAIMLVFGFYSELQVVQIEYADQDLPVEFDGYRIAFVSDFHCEPFGKEEEKLIQAIVENNPDIVVFTGDMIDGDHDSILAVKQLLAGLQNRYPMYAISGNHEDDIMDNDQRLLAYYEEYGVVNLDDSSVELKKEGATIGLYGLSYREGYYSEDFFEKPDYQAHAFNILLYHDAYAFPIVSKIGYDLVLSGHTHGGIVRLPFIGGLFNNKGTLFSDYDNGVYEANGSTLISSRGLGDASIPRYNNRRELIIVTLTQ